jgi:hypothetical protein
VSNYHQSKIKRNLHHGSAIIHPNYNSNEHILYTIPVTVSGDVQTKDRVKVTNSNALHTENSINGATMTKRKVKMNAPLNARYNTTLPCHFSFLCFTMYMNVRTYHFPCA